MTLDPTRSDLPPGAASLHAHCMSISASIASLAPTLIILSTPHGLALQQSAAIYQPYVARPTAQGSCEWKEQWKEYGVRVRIDGDVSGRLLEELMLLRRGWPDDRLNVEALVSFAGLSTPLRWGEAVPLYFALHDLVARQRGGGAQSTVPFVDALSASAPPVVILSQPRLGLTAEQRTEFRKEAFDKLQHLGSDLRNFIDQLPHRTLLVVSGDLAHAHPWPSLPDVYLPDPSSFNVFPREGRKQAETYDALVGHWMTGGREQSGEAGRWWLDEDTIRRAWDVEEAAISCGSTGLLTMHAVMVGESVAWAGKDGSDTAEWVLSDYSRETPSYYAMATALFTSNERIMRIRKADRGHSVE